MRKEILENGFKGIKCNLKPILFALGSDIKTAQDRGLRFRNELSDTFKDDHVLEPLIITNEIDARFIDELIEPNVDLLVLNVAGPRYIFRKLASIKIPIITWQDRGYSHAASWDTRGFLKKWGVNIYTPIGPNEATRLAKVISAIRALRHSKLLVLGKIPPPNVASEWCMEHIERKLGLEVENIAIDILLKLSDEIPEEKVKETFSQWSETFEDISEDKKEDLENVIRLYLAMKSLLKEKGANALTINCLQDLFSKRFIPPCIALARLIDEGIVAGCEADINVAISMMILSFISRGPSIMGNIYLFRPWPGPGFPPIETRIEDIKESLRNNIVRLTHDVIPLTMGTKNKFKLEDYHNLGKGVTAYVPIKSGVPVTLLRIRSDLEELFVIRGNILKVANTIHCRFSAWIKVNNAREIADEAPALHHAMIYGDWSRELKVFAELCNMRIKIV